MRPNALSVATIAKAKTGDVLRDESLPGLQLRVGKRSAVYYLYYRTRNGRERRPRIGDAAVVSLPQARAKAREWLGVVAAGGDPAALLGGPQGKTLAELRDRYMEAHAIPKKKASSVEQDRIMWRANIIPYFRESKPVQEFTKADIADLHHHMRDRPFAANRARSLLRKAFALCETWGWREGQPNPVVVDRYPEKKRRRKPSQDEARALLIALDTMRATDPHFVALVWLLCLTGARVSEIRTAKWEWITPAGLELPDSKTGARIIHLNQFALRILEQTPRLAGNPYIIPNSKGKVPLPHCFRRWSKLCELAGIPPTSKGGGLLMRDLRRFFASLGLSAGLTLEEVGELLGHKSYQTTKVYAYLLPERSATQSKVAADAVQRFMLPPPLAAE